MANHSSHTTAYKVLGRVLITLMTLTFLTIYITSIHLAALTVMVALLIAGIKGFLVMYYFMHLKYETLLLRILVSMTIVLFIVIVLVTFIDYSYR